MNLTAFDDWEGSEPGLLSLVVKVDIGGTGAPTLSTSYNRGIASITRNSAGNYTFAFREGVVDIVDVSLNVKPASFAAAEGNYVVPTVMTPGGASPLLTVQCAAGSDGTAADPDNGAVLFGTITVKLSNA